MPLYLLPSQALQAAEPQWLYSSPPSSKGTADNKERILKLIYVPRETKIVSLLQVIMKTLPPSWLVCWQLHRVNDYNREKANILTVLQALLTWMVTPHKQNTLKLTQECFYTPSHTHTRSSCGLQARFQYIIQRRSNLQRNLSGFN